MALFKLVDRLPFGRFILLASVCAIVSLLAVFAPGRLAISMLNSGILVLAVFVAIVYRHAVRNFLSSGVSHGAACLGLAILLAMIATVFTAGYRFYLDSLPVRPDIINSPAVVAIRSLYMVSMALFFIAPAENDLEIPPLRWLWALAIIGLSMGTGALMDMGR